MSTKPVHLLSFGANLVLLAIVICLLQQRVPAPAPTSMDQPAVVNPPPAPAGEMAEPANPAAATPAFRWSQLEAPDYPGYIVNLRAIGCPERTLAEIVTADVDTLYAPKRHEIERHEQLLAANTQIEWPASRQALAAERQRLWQEETDLIARLLRGQTAAPTGSPPSAALATASAAPGQPAKPSLPLVFADIDTNTLSLTPQQQSLIAGLRLGFNSQLGDLDPGSERYAENWQKAQPEVDRTLKQQLGFRAYQQLQIQARRKPPQAQPQP